jgi:hypothetical protein
MSITKLNNLSVSALTALPSGLGGKVLQVVTATDTTSRSTTSTSFVTASNTLSVSITPASASNKIFVIASFTSLAVSAARYTIFRGATNLGDSSFGMGGVSGGYRNASCISVLDSPSTTSATTYQAYIITDGSLGYFNTDNNKGFITAFEIAG